MVEGWEPSSAYDITAFYTRSTDDKGHFKQIRVAVPPEIAARIGQLVQARTIPQYKTMEAFVRDAIIHRLHWIGHEFVDTDVVREVERQAAAEKSNALRMDLEANVNHVEQLTENIRLAIQQQDWFALLSWYYTERNDLESYREPYRSRIQEQLKVAHDAIPQEVWESIA